ncbi:hypothetical protein V9K67_02440 [Paraflavisolibacter sp. H34]|uniref:hypothetical protein n=1 Tax=Huijunlia imazamoxiresistens TaxID=3127457 RepID=UPI003017E0C2
MAQKRIKYFTPVIVLFVVLTGFFIAGNSLLVRLGADQEVLLWGNLLLFVITLISFMMALRGLNDKNPNAFVRSIYGSMMIKLFVCIIAAGIYIAINRTGLNKPALFGCMGLYLVYLFMEVGILTKLLRGKANG